VQFKSPLDALRYHVSGAIERGEAEPIVAIEAELPVSRMNEAELYALMKDDTASVARRKEANFELHRRHYPDKEVTQ
jgi:hypothetical protein